MRPAVAEARIARTAARQHRKAVRAFMSIMREKSSAEVSPIGDPA
jgi:hypothetical protein